MSNTPRVGANGIFTLNTPLPIGSPTFTTIDGTCTAVVKISTLLDEGVDVKTTYYTPYGLDNDYAGDVSNDVSIVTITDNGGVLIYIPGSYFSDVPVKASVPYSRIVLSVDLQALPDALDLSVAMDAVRDLVSDITGKQGVVRIHKGDIPGSISKESHDLLELNRLLAINARPTPYAEVARLSAINADLSNRLALLENKVLSLIP